MRNRGTPPLPHLLKALLGAGSAKSVCKILMSNILEVKILRTNALGPQSSASVDRHCLDNDRAIANWAKGQMSQCGCGKRGACGGSELLGRRFSRTMNPK